MGPKTAAAKAIAAKANRILARLDPTRRGADEQQRQAQALLQLADMVSNNPSQAERGGTPAQEVTGKDREFAADMVQKLAWRAQGDGKLADTVAFYDIALSLHPQEDRYFLLGMVQLQLRDFANAQRSFAAVGGYHARRGEYYAKQCVLLLSGVDLDSAPAPHDPEEAHDRRNFLFYASGGPQARREKAEREAAATLAASSARAAPPPSPAPIPLAQVKGTDRKAAETRRHTSAGGLELATETAQMFAEQLVQGAFEAADAMLVKSLQPPGGAEDLRTAYLAMICHDDDDTVPDASIEVMWSDHVRDDLHRPGDLGCVYVAIGGDGFSEAVTVTVTQVDGEPRIRELEWGRP